MIALRDAMKAIGGRQGRKRHQTPNRGRGMSTGLAAEAALTISVQKRMRLFLLDALSALPAMTKPVNVLIVTHLPCLMVLDQVLPEVGVDLEEGEKAQSPVIQPEQVAVVHLQKQGTGWIGTVEHQ